MTQRRWLITGCSSGLGLALAQHLASTGEQVLATARDADTLTTLTALGPHVAVTALDVTDPQQCADAVQLAVDRFGGIDILVNNAGYGQFGVVEEVTDEELAAQIDTNVYGPWRLIRQVMPLWRAQGRGHAIFCSSVSGSVALPGLSAYTASKFALEGLAESLAVEAGHLGVKVTILQLGGFATSYGRKLHEPRHRIDAYEPVVADMLTSLRTMDDNAELSQPAQFAELVQHLAAMAEPPLRQAFGAGASYFLEPALAARQTALEQAKSTQAEPAPQVQPA